MNTQMKTSTLTKAVALRLRLSDTVNNRYVIRRAHDNSRRICRPCEAVSNRYYTRVCSGDANDARSIKKLGSS